MASGRPGAPMMGPWSDLPSSDLPGLVIARPRALPRRVPRLALRPAPPPRRFSRWIVLPDGTFVTVSNDGGGVHRMPFRRPAALGGGRNRQQQEDARSVRAAWFLPDADALGVCFRSIGCTKAALSKDVVAAAAGAPAPVLPPLVTGGCKEPTAWYSDNQRLRSE